MIFDLCEHIIKAYSFKEITAMKIPISIKYSNLSICLGLYPSAISIPFFEGDSRHDLSLMNLPGEWKILYSF